MSAECSASPLFCSSHYLTLSPISFPVCPHRLWTESSEVPSTGNGRLMLRINHRCWNSELKTFCDLIMNCVTCLSHFPSRSPACRSHVLHCCLVLSAHSSFILLPLNTPSLFLLSLPVLNSAILQGLGQLPDTSKNFPQPSILFHCSYLWKILVKSLWHSSP